MPSKQRKKWDAEAMKRAVEAVKRKEMGTLKASKIFKVPKSTLIDYVRSDKPTETLIGIKLGRKPALTDELEQALVQYALEMEQRFYGLRASDVRRLAFQLAIRNGLKHPFSARSAVAGKKWLKSFMSRHPQLSFRKPQGISAARVKGFTRENAQAFLNLLESVMPKINNNPAAIYNVDETGITSVQHKHSRVISLKVVTCMNAVGRFIPPMLVFPRKNMKPELLNGAPPGSIARCHPSGWIQQELFTAWLKHFIEHVKPNECEQVVLILDGHYSHSRNIDVINIAREIFIHIICLPPHSTHKLQPLDISFMSPFKTYYAGEIETWLKANPGRVVTAYQIAELMGRAYLRAASCEVAVNGFRKCGIFPFQPTIFRDDEFVIHSSNEREKDGNTAENVQPNQSPQPGCSGETSKRRGKRGSTSILTSTPYKTALEESLEQRKKVTPRQIGTRGKQSNQDKNMKTDNERGKTKKQRKKAQRSSSSSSNSDIDEIELIDTDDDMDQDEVDAECFYCSNFFSEDIAGSKWIRCMMCQRWCHEDCADVRNGKTFICEFCSDG
ncbi:hypothetical protein FQR65_LT14558 [Abscondita terminalis]|nr:hypothetical protein FQR65_LT14558 [Abscondita terminalis]